VEEFADPNACCYRCKIGVLRSQQIAFLYAEREQERRCELTLLRPSSLEKDSLLRYCPLLWVGSILHWTFFLKMCFEPLIEARVL